MALMFEEETRYPDNRPRANFVFFGFPYTPPIALEDYRGVLQDLEQELPLRLWYFLDEVTTDELMRKLWRAILRADLCIFDISGGNPNVAFEVGLAVARFKKCSTILRTGQANPLGGADMSYAERAEYTSVQSLRDVLRRLLLSKCSAMRIVRETANHLFDSSQPVSRADLEAHTTRVLNEIYSTGRITKQQAERLLENRARADAILAHLREIGVLALEGQKRGARWVFADTWVNAHHEVVGVA